MGEVKVSFDSYHLIRDFLSTVLRVADILDGYGKYGLTQKYISLHKQ